MTSKELRDELAEKFGKGISFLIKDFQYAAPTWHIKNSDKWLMK